MTNWLGRALRYMGDAWLYAAEPWIERGGKAAPVRGYGAILTDAARREPYRSPESHGEKYRLAVMSSWVWSDLEILANRTAADAARPQLYKPGSEERVADHPLTALLARPNSFMSGQYLWRVTSWWYDLRGNAYWYIATDSPRPGRGRPHELWPLVAEHVAPQPHTFRTGEGVFRGQMVVDYLYRLEGTDYLLPGENIIHFRRPNPFDIWEGLSPLAAALLAVEMDRAQGGWTRDFFAKENAIPSAVISLRDDMGAEQFDETVRRLRQQMSDGQRRLFARGGDLSVAVISQTLEQMQIIQSREFTRDEIDRVYGVPEGLMSGGLSGDSRLAADIAFSRNTIQPRVDYIAEQIEADLLPYYDDGSELRSPNIVPQDRALQVQERAIYGQDQTLNENRKERGLAAWQAPAGLELLNSYADVPVRLLAMVPAADNLRMSQDAGVGSLPGAHAPTAMVEDMAGKVAEMARQADLKRWRKVALAEHKAGRAPDGREFTSAVLPDDVRQIVAERLAAAQDESEVRAAFAAPFCCAHADLEWDTYP